MLPETYLKILEPEALCHILQLLPAESIVSFGMTCKEFNELSQRDSIWESICLRDWDSSVVKDIKATFPRPKKWLEIYRDLISLKAGSWEQIQLSSNSPRSRASHSLTLLDSDLVLYGGGCEGGRHLDDTWLSQIPSLIQPMNWCQISSNHPAGRFQHSCTAIGSSLLLFGGINDFGARSQETWLLRGPQTTNQLSVSPWEILSPLESPSPRGAHAAAPLSGLRVVVYGGIDQDGIRLGDTWVLDLSQTPLTWRKLEIGVGPEPRSGHSLTQISDDRVVLFGGRGPKLEVLGDVWILDVSRPYWTKLEPPLFSPIPLNPCDYGPGPRAGHSATPLVGGRVLVFGGEDNRRIRKSDVWVLDPQFGIEARCHSPPCSPNCQRIQPHQGSGKRRRGRDSALRQVPSDNGGLDAQVVPEMENFNKLAKLEVPGRFGTLRGSDSMTSSLDTDEESRDSSRSNSLVLRDLGNKGEMWREVICSGDLPAGRSYHGACAFAGGCALFVFGGMVDGERRGHTAAGLTFDNKFYALWFTERKRGNGIALSHCLNSLSSEHGSRS